MIVSAAHTVFEYFSAEDFFTSKTFDTVPFSNNSGRLHYITFVQTAAVVTTTGIVILILLIVTVSILTLNWVCFALLSMFFHAFQLATNLIYLRDN